MTDGGMKPISIFKDIAVNITASVILALGGGLFFKTWHYILAFGALGFFAAAFYYRKNYERFWKLKRGGVKEYYYTFDLSGNKAVLDGAAESLCYFGVTAATVVEFLRARTSRNDLPQLKKCKFLLMDPQSDALKRQIAFRNGVAVDTPLESIDHALKTSIEEEYKTAQERIDCSMRALRELLLFKAGNLEIRLHDGFLPWWMYVVDDAKIYLGVLERGKNGLYSPVVVMTKVPGFPSPFDAFKNMWDITWANARPVK